MDKDQHKQDSSAGALPSPRHQSVTLSLPVRKITQFLVVWVIFLAILGGFSHYVTFQIVPGLEEQFGRGVRNVMRRIGLEEEPSLAHWYSSVAILACGIAAGIIGVAKKRMNDSFVGWGLLCFLFCFLALDEGIEIHELFSKPLRLWLDTGGALYWAWVLPYGLLALVVGIASLRFLIDLEPGTRRLFVLSGTLYCASAIGAEMIGSTLYARYGFESTAYLVINSLEELGEMLAIVIMLYALLSYINRHVGRVEFSIDVSDDG